MTLTFAGADDAVPAGAVGPPGQVWAALRGGHRGVWAQTGGRRPTRLLRTSETPGGLSEKH